MTWPYLDADLPIAFAHRGGNEMAPENTVGAFAHATSLGYRYLETDVHITKDGTLVAFHDGGLERLTGVEGAIADQSWSDLQRIDLGAGHRVPTMDELFETFPTARFTIEPKSDAAVQPLIDAVRRHDAIDRVCIGSFVDERIAAMRDALGPTLCTSPGPRSVARLMWTVLGRGAWDGDGHGCVQIPPSFGPLKMSRRIVDGIHDLGLQIHVWTINDAPIMHWLLDLGVDAIMTDNVELLRDVLVDRGQWTGPLQSTDED